MPVVSPYEAVGMVERFADGRLRGYIEYAGFGRSPLCGKFEDGKATFGFVSLGVTYYYTGLVAVDDDGTVRVRGAAHASSAGICGSFAHVWRSTDELLPQLDEPFGQAAAEPAAVPAAVPAVDLIEHLSCDPLPARFALTGVDTLDTGMPFEIVPTEMHVAADGTVSIASIDYVGGGVPGRAVGRWTADTLTLELDSPVYGRWCYVGRAYPPSAHGDGRMTGRFSQRDTPVLPTTTGTFAYRVRFE